jgi:DNA helicase-2/ATP-dependent DNA helicase PcrA
MDFSTLNPQQEEAVSAPEKPLLIVAGAGTGKTRTLIARLLYLIERGVHPESLCAITFTNKAAKEMMERFEVEGSRLLEEKGRVPNLEPRTSFTRKTPRQAGPNLAPRKPFIGTFHSFGSRILREHARLADRTASFAIFDTDDSFSLIKKILKRLGVIKNERLKPSLLSRKISSIKNGSLSLQVLENSARDDDRKIAEVFLEYEKDLKENNAFDFDDLLQKCVVLLSTHPAVCESYRKRYLHILVDEYQDINRTQYELLKLLAGGRNAITVVGDDQQTIYGWRGSDIGIFLDFENDWPDAKVVVLDQNYRSTPTIITAASALIANNRKQKTKTLWTENADGERIAVREWGSEDEEAMHVARAIQELRIKNNELWAEERDTKSSLIHNSQFIIPSIAVLYRTNAQSRAIEQSLIEEGIPYQVFGGLKFYERKEIRDIIAALRYVSNPSDSVSYERLEKTFFRRKTAAVLEHLLAFKRKKTHEIIEEFLKVSGYFEYLDAHFTNADERRENIAELIYFASGYESLSGFLESASLLQSADAPSSQKSVVGSQKSEEKNLVSNFQEPNPVPVQLMTIHLAKGLEFDHVFLIGCREDLMPHAFSLETESEIEEERRLLYVAMTRPRKSLHISYHDVPSRFLFEIPEKFTAFQSSAGDEIFSDAEEKYISFD